MTLEHAHFPSDSLQVSPHTQVLQALIANMQIDGLFEALIAYMRIDGLFATQAMHCTSERAQCTQSC